MKCKFVVGQKVVCIKELTFKCAAGNKLITEAASPVKIGHIYTIVEIDVDTFDSRIVLRFAELPGDEWFQFNAFKPLEERKTDISVFTRMLKQKEMIDG